MYNQAILKLFTLASLVCATPARAGMCEYQLGSTALTLYTGDLAQLFDEGVKWRGLARDHGAVTEVWQEGGPYGEEFTFIGRKSVVGVTEAGQEIYGTPDRPCLPPAMILKECPDKKTVYLLYLKRKCFKLAPREDTPLP